LVGATLDEARDVLNRVRIDLAALLEKAETPRFTSSFGLAHSTDHHSTDELVRAADVALYRAKENGRDQVTLSTAMTADMPERRLLETIATLETSPAPPDERPGRSRWCRLPPRPRPASSRHERWSPCSPHRAVDARAVPRSHLAV